MALSMSNDPKVNNTLDEIHDAVVNKSVVKSVQRGKINNLEGVTITVTISEVNPNKSIVLLNGYTASGGCTLPHLDSMTDTSISINCIGNTTAKHISWQVIEYY